MNPLQRSPAAFARLTQLSMITVLLVQLFVPVPAYLTHGNTSPQASAWPVAIMTLAGLPALALGVLTLLFIPQLNVHPQRNVEPFFRWGMVANIAYALVGMGLYIGLGTERLTSGDNQYDWQLVGLFSVYFGAMTLSWGFLPWVNGRWLWAGLVTIFVYLITEGELGLIVLIVPTLGVACGVSSQWMIDVVKDLDRARETEATLRISQERLRIAQQLHDSLGQNLAAISLKTQVAKAFAAQQDSRLAGELNALQELVTHSVEDMRQVVRGYRTLDVPTELAHARTLLEDVGVAVHVEGAPEDIPTAHQDIVGWFVREATTNILRHAQATHADFSFTPHRAVVVNDGASGPVGQWGGLDSLRRRHETTGGTLSVRTPQEGQFEVEMELVSVADE